MTAGFLSRAVRGARGIAMMWFVLAGGIFTQSVQAQTASSQTAQVHVVRQGETLASVSLRYYGTEAFERVLVAENALGLEGGQRVVPGLRLRVPAVLYHIATPGETWRTIADVHYSNPALGRFIARANQAESGSLPDPGAQLLIPYPLRVTVSRRDTLKRLSSVYLGSASKENVRMLREFNRAKSIRVKRGQIILIPLTGLVFSQAFRERVDPDGGGGPERMRARQAANAAALTKVDANLRAGQYVRAVAGAQRLLGSDTLTSVQTLRAHVALAVAYVSLRRDELAVDAFVAVLKSAPDFSLKPADAAPKVRRALKRAKSKLVAPEAKPDST